MTPENFVRANTQQLAPPLTPEITLHLAHEIVPIWRATEEELAAQGIPPPFWAFAWAGGQALARYVLDHPETVARKRVLDFGAGSGLAAIAAAKAGATHVQACDIDPFAAAAMAVNAAANHVDLAITTDGLLGQDLGWDTVLIADMCYEKSLSARVEAWMRDLAQRGALVLIGDPQRTYFPKTGLALLAQYEVQTTRELEDREIRRTGVYRVLPASAP
ncbi:MAG TPA: nicotinamide N-methylase [Alphaproteobacteria bacterium]|nr:nicotinamide N-methylase [Alphaproteobacteria bacterium]HAJ45351.1 nicotinamide N-methylase [Alphaproteobacteria bacterium]